MGKFTLHDFKICQIGWKDDYGIETMTVGSDGITKIDSVEQYLGEDSGMIWIQVWRGSQLKYRFNAFNLDFIQYGDLCD